MANDLKININGAEYSIEGDDLATEATLRALLAATRKQNQNRATDEEKRRRSDEFNRRKQQMEDERRKKINDQLSQGTNSFSNASKATGGIFGSLRDKMGGLLGKINPLGLLMGGLGTIVGGVISVFSAMMGVVTEMTTSMKELYASGARFNLNMSEMARNAGEAGMGITQFVGFLNKNQAAIAQFGSGSITDSVDNFRKITKTLFGTAKAGLVGLGMSMEEVGQVLADYSTIQQYLTGQSITTRHLNESEAEVTARIVRDTTRYVNTLDGMARATGKTRDELNALAQNMAKDVDINATLRALNLPADRRDELIKFTTLVSSLGGSTMLAGVKSVLQLGTLTGETASAFARVGPQLGSEITRITMGLANGSIKQEEAQEMYTNALANNAEAIGATLGLIPEESRNQAEKDIVAAAQQALERRALQKKQLLEMKEAMAKQRKLDIDKADILISDVEAATELNKKRSAEVAATEQMNQALAKAKAILPTILLKIFANKTFQDVWENIFGETGVISRVSGKILDLLKPGQTIMGFFSGLYDALATEMRGAWKFIAEMLAPVMKWIGDKVEYFLNTTVKEWFGNVLTAVPGLKVVGEVMVAEAQKLRALTEATSGVRGAAADKPALTTAEDNKDPELLRLKEQRAQLVRDSEELIASRNSSARRATEAKAKLEAAEKAYEDSEGIDLDSPTGRGVATKAATDALTQARKEYDAANESAILVTQAITEALPGYTKNIQNVDAAIVARDAALKAAADKAAAAEQAATPAAAAPTAPVGTPASEALAREVGAVQPTTPAAPAVETPKAEETASGGTTTPGTNTSGAGPTALNTVGAKNPMFDPYNMEVLDVLRGIRDNTYGKPSATGGPVMQV